jgi:urocanate hydratase
MGGAQPLAATMNGGVALVVEVDPARIERGSRRATSTRARDASTRRSRARARVRARGRRVSIALVGNAADVLPELVRARRHARRRHRPDLAHDALNGYVPERLSLAEATRCARAIPTSTSARSIGVDGAHVRARCSRCSARRGHVRLRQQHPRAGEKAGVADAFDIPGFVPEYIRPLFCEGKGPFRWAALSGDPADIASPTRGARDVPDDDARCAAGSRWRASASRSRDCRRASAGSATASAREVRAARSTSSSRAARSRRRS